MEKKMMEKQEMKTFEVEVVEPGFVVYVYTIEADTKEEALAKANKGEASLYHRIDSYPNEDEDMYVRDDTLVEIQEDV